MDLSVVIPIRNQGLSLDLTLYWFAKMLPENCELVVVDDGSDEDIKSITDHYKASVNIKYIRRDQGGRAVARNTGIKVAEGKRILFNDGDRFPAESDLTDHINKEGIVTGTHLEHYFLHLEQKIDRIKNDFAGIQRTARKIMFPTLIQEHIYSAKGECQTNLGWMSFLTGNVSAPKDAIIEAGMFDEKFTLWGVEHFDLGYRLWKQGIPFSWSDKAKNYHIAHSREAGFYRKNMIQSTDYFYHKYNDDILAVFADFLFGKVNLQDLENSADKVRYEKAAWLNEFTEPIYFKGLQSDILAAQSKK